MTAHPLDPISADEVRAAAAACRKRAAAEGVAAAALRFNTITLAEPAKADLLAFAAGAPAPPRRAFCILQAPPRGGAVEALVDLPADGAPAAAASWARVEGVQPMATPDDCLDAEAVCKADAEVVKIMAEAHGVTDMAMVAADPWSVHAAPADLRDRRLIQCFMYLRVGDADDNHYAHPLDFVPIVDLDERRVVRIERPWGAAPPPVPAAPGNFHRRLGPPPRAGLRALDVLQPDGPSFAVEGNEIAWQKWRMRVSFNYREGLVIHDVSYDDGAGPRPVLHRAAMVEMAVPYGDPAGAFPRKCAFDVGDYGLGNCTMPLALGCDCLGEIFYFDAVLNDSKGEPVVVEKAVCLHEEDASISWKHAEYRSGHSEVRRSRRLVLQFCATVVNYEYILNWIFTTEGTIEYQIKLTGELSTNLLSPGEGPAPAHGTLVAPGVNAQVHQHLFSVRLDMAVDCPLGGKGVGVSEVDVVAAPAGPGNPELNAFGAVETPLLREAGAQRMPAPERGRFWKISNPNILHPITGKPVAWKLVVPAAPLLLAPPGSALAARGAFATRQLWVTPHADAERWPAGAYPMQSAGGGGLPAWTAADRPCGPGADPVIWLTLGATHIPRVEDYPVMSCEVVSFHLKPANFFGANPALDLPAAANAASRLAGAATCCAAGGGGADGAANGDGAH